MLSPIKSIKAKCRDCHKCIRACPVKAIKLRHGQAQVVAEQCISCGACLAACPQKAKTVLSHVEAIRSMLANKQEVCVSLAPSYPAAFCNITPGQVIAGLRALGFALIEETAVAAERVAMHYSELLATRDTTISSCCPAIVNLIEIYFPELLPHVADSASPMVIHANDLRARHPGAKVVFIGPCVAKIQEASREYVDGALDAVLTFEQLQELWRLNGIEPGALPEMRADAESMTAAVYPLSRGILSTVGLPADELSDCLSISGLDSCLQVFKELRNGKVRPRFIEALACADGCIGGPGIPNCESIAVRRSKVVAWHKQRRASEQPFPGPHDMAGSLAKAEFRERIPRLRKPTEDEIRSILAHIGKHSPEDETNCGGCGYPTCRDKAIATYQGLAEVDMCVPYMRAKFESLSHLVVDSSLNAIIVVNKDLTIHQFNPTAQRLFNSDDRPTRGSHLALFIDPSDFAAVAETGMTVHKRVDYPEFGICTSQTIYPVPDYHLIVGIITDITEMEKKRKELEKKHSVTVQRASQVIKNQMKLAQEIAGLLGEATAETKATLLELISTLENEAETQ